ncbi:hypothetical protein EVAR_97640_1 [Eumeta japonica]|uniref:Uncharacterized protein n=1 Tax=Eumeta variegata TaxID=151549 RepID=A0A4C1WWV4_EUMVA|nr:hypothetical protein EVAR_97640_1 [Eumeta japonica]
MDIGVALRIPVLRSYTSNLAGYKILLPSPQSTAITGGLEHRSFVLCREEKRSPGIACIQIKLVQLS